ncbi:MAG: hypothetical protein ACRCU2_19145 [Planktothrix sp.]
MAISQKTLIAAVSLPLLGFLYFGLNVDPSSAQPTRGDICTSRNYPPAGLASSNSKTHVIADGYQFDYPANYRLVLKNDGSLFVTDERNYQYYQCLLEHRPPGEFLPNGINISWRTPERLQANYSSRLSVDVISTQTISGRSATFFTIRGGYDDFIQARIPSRGGYVVIDTFINNNQIIMEDAFFRILRSIAVP